MIRGVGREVRLTPGVRKWQGERRRRSV